MPVASEIELICRIFLFYDYFFTILLSLIIKMFGTILDTGTF